MDNKLKFVAGSGLVHSKRQGITKTIVCPGEDEDEDEDYADYTNVTEDFVVFALQVSP